MPPKAQRIRLNTESPSQFARDVHHELANANFVLKTLRELLGDDKMDRATTQSLCDALIDKLDAIRHSLQEIASADPNPSRQASACARSNSALATLPLGQPDAESNH